MFMPYVVRSDDAQASMEQVSIDYSHKPNLYLTAFGLGLGRGISMNGTTYLEFVVPGIIALTAMTSSLMVLGFG